MEYDAFATFAESLAECARPIARQYFRTPVKVEMKADASPVSLADRAIERTIRERIRDAYPDHGILGEEEGAHALEAEYVWVIDPIDGTRAFLAGKPTFTTLIALCRNGTPVLGLIDQAFTQERWLGVHGHPTRHNDAPVSCRTCPELARATFATTSPFYFSATDRPRVDRVRDACATYVFGGDAYGYALMAGGGVDIVVESGLKPYDFCALAPVIEGAGGIVTDWAGNALTLASKGDVLACGDARVHREARSRLAA